MKKESKATNSVFNYSKLIVESIFYSLILTIIIISLPFLLGMILNTPNAESVNVFILLLCVVIEAIIVWLSLLTDFIKDDELKEKKEDEDDDF